MIIAEIGISKFILDDLKSAETLLRIMSAAKQVSDTYVGSNNERVTYQDKYSTHINISIRSDTEILSYRDAMDLKESAREKVESDL